MNHPPLLETTLMEGGFSMDKLGFAYLFLYKSILSLLLLSRNQLFKLVTALRDCPNKFHFIDRRFDWGS